MSPELLDPEARDNRRTKFSDCYALGMVIYEVLSGRTPFYQYQNAVIPRKVLRGDRPERPQGEEGAWFTDDVWTVLEHCWMPQPGDRPSIEDILRSLEEASRSWTPPLFPPMAGSLTQESSDKTIVGSKDASVMSPPSQVTPHQPSLRLDRGEPAGVVGGVGLTHPLDEL